MTRKEQRIRETIQLWRTMVCEHRITTKASAVLWDKEVDAIAARLVASLGDGGITDDDFEEILVECGDTHARQKVEMYWTSLDSLLTSIIHIENIPMPTGIASDDHTRVKAPQEIIDGIQQDLKAWRTKLATAERKPAYCFMLNIDIERLSTNRPTTLKELKSYRFNKDKYASEVLEIIRRNSGI